MNKPTIAITIFNDQTLQQMFFGNGIAQNIKFLYDLLSLMGYEPFLIGNKKTEGGEIRVADKRYRMLTLREIGEQNIQTDLVLEIGLTVNGKNRKALKERFGSRIVCVRYGHTLFMDMEQICHSGISAPGIYESKPDRVWASPHFENSFSYLRTLYSAPVDTVPYIWEPDLVGKPFSENDYKSVPDLYVMEPNISIIKNALIPMTIIERFYRKHPDKFGKASIVNGTKFNQDRAFLENFVRHMPVFNAETNRAVFSDRATFANVFKERDLLIGHQYGCELNYLYLEALYKNIPLVHNSPALKDAGYYYPEFDAEQGSERLLEAVQDRNIDRYRSQSQKILDRFSIHNPDVQRETQRLIELAVA